MSETCQTCLIEIADATYIKLNQKDVQSKTVLADLLACVPELDLNLVEDPVICQNCLHTLQLAYCFKTRCLLAEQLIRSCIQRANLNGKRVTLMKLLRLSREAYGGNNCSGLNCSVVRDVSKNPIAGEQPRRASLVIEAVNDQRERANDSTTSTAIEDSDVVMSSEVSVVDGEDENDIQNIITNDGAITGLTLQPLEFRDKILGLSSAAACTDIKGEMSQDLDNTMDDTFVKEECDLSRFKVEADETSSLKNENVNDEERSYYYKTVNLSEGDDVKEETRSITDDAEERSNNCNTSSLCKDNNAYTVTSDDISQRMGDTDEGSLTKEEHELGTFKPKQPLNEKTFNGCTADIGFVNKEYSVNLQRLHLGDLINKSTFNANESLNLTTAKSLQTNKKPESARHNGSNNLSKHGQACSTKKSFCCTVCKYSTTLKRSLVKHMRIHTGEKPFQCKVCEYSAVEKQNLFKHMRTHTGEKPFKCNICEYSAVQKQNLIIHMRTHTGEKPFKCNVCEYSTVYQQNLISHMRTHTGEKPFKCNVCEYSAVEKKNLIRHMRRHTGGKPFKCNVCEYSAIQKQNLITHMRTHTGEKPFKCNVCEYSAVQKQNLINHMRTHTGEKPFKCNVCEYSAVQKQNLINHMRTHTGEKPFKCNVCDYSAVQKQHLIIHMRTHFDMHI